MITNILPADKPETIGKAVSLIRDGGVVAFPTDTVYGLGALAWDFNAIDELFQIKGRNADKAIAVLVGKSTDINTVSNLINAKALILSEHFWPGALTLVVKRHPSLPDNISPADTIGIRMPNHPVALELLEQTGPLAVTSANLSGKPDALTAFEVHEQLWGRVALIIDAGKVPGGIPSTVVDCTGKDIAILREGPISLDQLKTALK